MPVVKDTVCAQHGQLISEHIATRVTLEGLSAAVHAVDGRVLELIEVVAGSMKKGGGPGLVHAQKNLSKRFDDHIEEHHEKKREHQAGVRQITRRVVAYMICSVIAGLAVLAWTGSKTKEIKRYETRTGGSIVRDGSRGGNGNGNGAGACP